MSEFKTVTAEALNNLARPIPKRLIKTMMRDKQQISFITARTVMNRLDYVLGRENWRSEYRVLQMKPMVVECTLFIRVGAEWVGKADVGTESNWSPEKGAYSDAMKRAGAQWGIGRELYGEGNAFEEDDEPETEQEAKGTAPAPPPANQRRIPGPTPNPRAAQEAPAVPPQAHQEGQHAQEGAQVVQPAANGGNGPVSHQDGQGAKWAQEKRNIRALMGKAEILWADEKLPAPRVINRMALAWGLNGTASSDFNKLCELAAAQVTFSQDDAWKRIQTYTPGSDTSDAPPMCECNEGTQSGEGPYPELCIRCANERANSEAARQ